MIVRESSIGSNSSWLKSHNLRAILLALLRHELASRARLAELTGLSTTAVTNLVGELLREGIVVEEGREMASGRQGAGRPRTALRLVPDARYAIGIHIGVGSVRAAVTDLRATPLSYLTLSHPLEKSPRAVLEETAQMVREAVAESDIKPEAIIGIGVGASGLVNPHISTTTWK